MMAWVMAQLRSSRLYHTSLWETTRNNTTFIENSKNVEYFFQQKMVVFIDGVADVYVRFIVDGNRWQCI